MRPRPHNRRPATLVYHGDASQLCATNDAPNISDMAKPQQYCATRIAFRSHCLGQYRLDRPNRILTEQRPKPKRITIGDLSRRLEVALIVCRNTGYIDQFVPAKLVQFALGSG